MKTNNPKTINEEQIENKIYTLRGVQVMLDRDLVELYQVETRRINEQVKRTIITKPLSKQLKLDINKYNSQYDNLEIKTSNTFHDRFLIMDDKELYHIGASLKDLGKRVFAFSKMDTDLFEAIKLHRKEA